MGRCAFRLEIRADLGRILDGGRNTFDSRTFGAVGIGLLTRYGFAVVGEYYDAVDGGFGSALPGVMNFRVFKIHVIVLLMRWNKLNKLVLRAGESKCKLSTNFTQCLFGIRKQDFVGFGAELLVNVWNFCLPKGD